MQDKDALAYIGKCISEGYIPLVISTEGIRLEQSTPKLPNKCLLILADDSKWLSETLKDLAPMALNIGDNLSVHVEAAICTWAYVKQHLL